MEAIAQKHRFLWRNVSYVHAVLFGAGMLTLGIAASVFARAYLLRVGAHVISSPDFFLDRLPVMGMENFLVWGVPLLLVLAAILLGLYPERLPLLLRATGLLFLLRSFFVILTPMGIRPDQFVTGAQGLFQGLAYNSNDFFFSGHVAFPFLLALVFWNERPVRYAMLAFSALFAAAVLLAHTHYSIDVFAVPFIVPTMFRLAERLFREDVSVSAIREQSGASPAVILADAAEAARM